MTHDLVEVQTKSIIRRKRSIDYIAHRAAGVENETTRQGLCLRRYYLSISIADDAVDMHRGEGSGSWPGHVRGVCARRSEMKFFTCLCRRDSKTRKRGCSAATASCRSCWDGSPSILSEVEFDRLSRGSSAVNCSAQHSTKSRGELTDDMFNVHPPAIFRVTCPLRS